MATQLGLLAQARGSASDQGKAARVAASECGQRASFKSGFQSESVGVFPARRIKHRRQHAVYTRALNHGFSREPMNIAETGTSIISTSESAHVPNLQFILLTFSRHA